MVEINKQLLHRLIGFQTPMLLDFCKEVLREQFGYQTFTDGENYIIATVDPNHEQFSSLALVAHLDTMRAEDKDVDLYYERNRLRNRNGVLGADDRAGVFAILELIRMSEKRPVVIFTNGEERGGIGVKKMIEDQALEPFLSFIDLFVQFDRRGYGEYVFYYAKQPEQVKSWAEYYDFREGNGTYSDVSDISRRYRIPHVNLSVGYYFEHSKREYLNLTELAVTIDSALAMLTEDSHPRGIALLEENFRYDSANYNSYYRPWLERDHPDNLVLERVQAESQKRTAEEKTRRRMDRMKKSPSSEPKPLFSKVQLEKIFAIEDDILFMRIVMGMTDDQLLCVMSDNQLADRIVELMNKTWTEADFEKLQYPVKAPRSNRLPPREEATIGELG